MMDLKDALRTIRNECRKYDYCDNCPLRTEFNECSLKEFSPVEWNFTFDEEPIRDRLII